jgi:hypothetical protein
MKKDGIDRTGRIIVHENGAGQIRTAVKASQTL